MPQIPDFTNDRVITGMNPQAPPGWHTMKIKTIDVGRSQAGNEVHKVLFEVSEGSELGCIARENFTLSTEVGRGRYKALIVATLGVKNFAGLTTEMLLEKALRVFVVHETFEGQRGDEATAAKAAKFEAIHSPAAYPNSKPDQKSPRPLPQESENDLNPF